jgi:uncharacterized membrane protein
MTELEKYIKTYFGVGIDDLSISAGLFAQNNSKMKSINENAPLKCSKTITINVSSEKVWTVMTNINNWATWQTEISNPKLNGELKPERM